jgi:hypothetical protein
MKSKKKLFGSMTYQSLISEWNLNKVLLASKMGMNAYTFKMKLLGTYPQYFFTEAEEQKLIEVLRELAADIEKVAGISFNKALATVVKKKV